MVFNELVCSNRPSQIRLPASHDNHAVSGSPANSCATFGPTSVDYSCGNSEPATRSSTWSSSLSRVWSLTRTVQSIKNLSVSRNIPCKVNNLHYSNNNNSFRVLCWFLLDSTDDLCAITSIIRTVSMCENVCVCACVCVCVCTVCVCVCVCVWFDGKKEKEVEWRCAELGEAFVSFAWGSQPAPCRHEPDALAHQRLPVYM